MKIYKKNVFFIILFFILLPNISYAKDFFAILQFKDPNTGLIQQVFQRCDSKWLAKKLNASHWNGVRTSCPDCIKEIESCIETIPPSYKGIFQNRPIIFPYLSSKKDRIVYSGVPMQEAIKVAKWMENAYKIKLNRPAKAIMPLTLTE